MQNLGKSLVHAALALAGGMLAWQAIVSMTAQATSGLAPALVVTLMGLYIIAFAVLAFVVHLDSVAGLPYETAARRRRPSLVIPSVSTIALMVFVVSWAASHPGLWGNA